MRRSSSISASILALATLPAGLHGAESLEASLRAEIGVAERRAVYLVLETSARELQIRSHGVVLDRVPLFDVRLRGRDLPISVRERPLHDVPAILTIARGAPQRRKIVIGGATAGEATDVGARPPGLTSRPPEPGYACRLDNDWILRVTDRGRRAGRWSRLWRRLSAPFVAGSGERGASATLIVALPPADAERLRHLFGKGRELLIR